MGIDLILTGQATVQDLMELWNLGYAFTINDGRIAGIEYPAWKK